MRAALALLCFAFALVAQAEEGRDTFVPQSFPVSVQTQASPLRFSLGVAYSQFNVNNIVLGGTGAGGNLLLSINSNWSGFLGFQQAFTQNFAAFFTQIDLGVLFALTGSLSSVSETLLAQGTLVERSRSFNTGGWRLQLAVSQFFVNTDSRTIPFTGGGLGLMYELPTRSSLCPSFSVRASRLSNDKIVIYPVQASLGISFWM